jgi:hypothetical protein
MRVPEPPTRETLGGVLVFAKDKSLSGTRLMARTLAILAWNGRRRWAALRRDRRPMSTIAAADGRGPRNHCVALALLAAR